MRLILQSPIELYAIRACIIAGLGVDLSRIDVDPRSVLCQRLMRQFEFNRFRDVALACFGPLASRYKGKPGNAEQHGEQNG